MTSMPGHCLCGAVRFDASDVETHHHACHCGMCRRWSGGPMFAASAGAVAFEGQENIATYDSSEWARRGFCKVCGTNLFYQLRQTGQYFLAVGSFEDATPFRLAAELCIDMKPEGYALAGEHPRLTQAEVFAKFSSD